MRRMALAATIALAATRASAQFPGGQGGASRRGSVGPPAGFGAPESRAGITADSPASLRTRVQVQLDRLEDELKIHAAQQQSWDAYAARVVRLADDVGRERFAAREAPAADANASQQFDRVVQGAQDRAAALGDVAAAARALYATLGPEQRTIADRRLAALPRALATGAALPAEARPGEASPEARGR